MSQRTWVQTLRVDYFLEKFSVKPVIFLTMALSLTSKIQSILCACVLMFVLYIWTRLKAHERRSMNWALMVSNQLSSTIVDFSCVFFLSILVSCKSGNSLEKSLNNVKHCYSPLVFLLLFMKMFYLSCFHLSHIIFIVCFYVNIVHFLCVYYRCRCCFFTPMLLNAIQFYSKLIWLPSILRRFFGIFDLIFRLFTCLKH